VQGGKQPEEEPDPYADLFAKRKKDLATMRKTRSQTLHPPVVGHHGRRRQGRGRWHKDMRKKRPLGESRHSGKLFFNGANLEQGSKSKGRERQRERGPKEVRSLPIFYLLPYVD
jgi:hypothetical protein